MGVTFHGVFGEPGNYCSVTRVHGDGAKEIKVPRGRNENETESKESKYQITQLCWVATFKRALVCQPDLIVSDQRKPLSTLMRLCILGEHSASPPKMEFHFIYFNQTPYSKDNKEGL